MQMYTFSILGRMLALFAIGTTAAFAQNLVENPYFDADLSSWQIFPSGSGASVEWTPDMNHVDGFESRSGAVSITAPNVESFAQQCVGVEDNDLYIVTAWTYEQCVGAADLYVFWANNDCVYDGKYEAIHARSTKTGEWEQSRSPAWCRATGARRSSRWSTPAALQRQRRISTT